MKKDDLIAEANNLGLGKSRDLTKLTNNQLLELIAKDNKDIKKELPRVIPKHDFYRG